MNHFIHQHLLQINKQMSFINHCRRTWCHEILNCNTQKMKRVNLLYLLSFHTNIQHLKNQKPNQALTGHGYRINHVLTHPSDNNIIITCSDDQSLRIWNIETGHCLAIIAGHDGHRAAVLCADIHINGRYLVSCGQDHAIKIWDLKDLQKDIELSYKVSKNHENRKALSKSERIRKNNQITTKMIQFPVYSKQKIHTDYVDDLGWFGDMILSKSIENVIKIWLPPLDDFEKSIKTLGELRYQNGKEYLMRFDIDKENNLVVIGDINGRIYLFELDKYFEMNSIGMDVLEDEVIVMERKEDDDDDDEDDNIQKIEHWHTLLKPRFVSKYQPIMIELPDCDVPVRSVKFNRLGDLVVATDNGTIYRYQC